MTLSEHTVLGGAALAAALFFGGIAVFLWMQWQQQQHTLLWLKQSQDKLEELTQHIEVLGEQQNYKHQQWGLLLEQRLSSQDAHSQHLSQLGKKIESLSAIMANDTHRGAFGESQLTAILQDMFPSQLLHFQHILSNNRRVDAVLWMEGIDRCLCIDAKFPLEHFEKNAPDAIKKFKVNVKKHIKDIHDKYIIPGETIDMAVLFLPAESLFVWLHHNAPDILQYSQQQAVWLASPSTLPSLLHITLSLMKNHRVEQVAYTFMKEFQRILTLTTQLHSSIEKLEKNLNGQQQCLWTLQKEYRHLEQALKSVESYAINEAID